MGNCKGQSSTMTRLTSIASAIVLAISLATSTKAQATTKMFTAFVIAKGTEKDAVASALKARQGTTARGHAVGLVSNGAGYCVILRAGSAECWGGGSRVPTLLGLSGVSTLVFSTDYSFCAIQRSGRAVCIGSYAPSSIVPPIATSQGAVAKALRDVKAIASDYDGYCTLLSTGSVYCWGTGDNGELGNGLPIPESSSVPVPVSGLTQAASLVSDGYGYCALLTTGGAQCWGSNQVFGGGVAARGLLGDGGTEFRSDTPVSVKGLSDAKLLVSDHYGYCALLKSGSVDCWGNNTGECDLTVEMIMCPNFNGAQGMLGDGGTELYSDVPVAVDGLKGAVSLASDEFGYCAIVQGGAVECWGSNARGALGDGGTEQNSNVPVVVKAVAGAVSLSSDGEGYCALLVRGTAMCWGGNTGGCPIMQVGENQCTDIPNYVDGLLGDGGSELESGVPVMVRGLTGAVRLVSDGSGYCALLSNGGVDCWGSNSSGDTIEGFLGNDGNEFSSRVPVPVAGLGPQPSVSTTPTPTTSNSAPRTVLSGSPPTPLERWVGEVADPVEVSLAAEFTKIDGCTNGGGYSCTVSPGDAIAQEATQASTRSPAPDGDVNSGWQTMLGYILDCGRDFARIGNVPLQWAAGQMLRSIVDLEHNEAAYDVRDVDLYALYNAAAK